MTMERVPGDRGNRAVRRWWKKVGPDAVRKACDKAGITYEHFKHVAAGRRRMSPDSAAVFVRASAGALTERQLMPPKRPAQKAEAA